LVAELKLNDRDYCKPISRNRFLGQEFGTELECQVDSC